MTGWVEQRRPSSYHHVNKANIIKKKRICKRKERIVQVKRPLNMASLTLQNLFDCCQHVFKGPASTVPPPCDVQRLCNILDVMKPEDVGLSMDLQFFQPKATVVDEGITRVTYATIYKCHSFSLCIFFLPATAVIPLHNHPGMTVFSKLLLGTMHIKSYDWVDPGTLESPSSKLRLARMKVNRNFKAPSHTSVLYPTSGGNIHEFTAITPCAVLDVLGPPYSKDDGRDCSYYKDTPFTAFPNLEGFAEFDDDGHSYGWLEEIEMPKEAEMDGIQYMGPQIQDSTC